MNRGNTNSLRKRLTQQIFDGAARQFEALEAARSQIEQTERLHTILAEAGRDAGQSFDPEVTLGIGRPTRCQVITYSPVAVADVLGTILRAGLHYSSMLSDTDGPVAIRIHGYEPMVVIYKPILDVLEAA